MVNKISKILHTKYTNYYHTLKKSKMKLFIEIVKSLIVTLV